MKQRSAEILLASVIVARATSLLFSKLSMRSMGPFNLTGLRFALAFAVLLLLFRRKFKDIRPATVLRGFALGAAFFATIAAELYGLRATDSSTTSFLENTAIVWVPLMEAAIHRSRLRGRTLGSALVTLLGVGLLTLGKSSFRLGHGELLCLLAALLYATAILLTAKFSREDDPLVLGILQVGFIGLLGLAAAFLLETPRLPQSGGEWGLYSAAGGPTLCERRAGGHLLRPEPADGGQLGDGVPPRAAGAMGSGWRGADPHRNPDPVPGRAAESAETGQGLRSVLAFSRSGLLQPVCASALND